MKKIGTYGGTSIQIDEDSKSKHIEIDILPCILLDWMKCDSWYSIHITFRWLVFGFHIVIERDDYGSVYNMDK